MRSLLLALVFGCPVLLPAVTLTWDTAATAGYQTGSGTWAGATAWSLDGLRGQAWIAGADALFRGSAGGGTETIALSLPVEVGDLAFGGLNGEAARGDWTLIGASLTLTRASRCDVGAGSRVQLSVVTFGAEKWTKGGEGELCLAEESVRRGGLTVEGGSLVFRHALGAGSGAVEMAGGRLSLESGGAIYNPLLLTAARMEVAVGTDVATLAPTVATWAGVISGQGKLIKTGEGELRLAGANTFVGGVLVQGGMVVVSQGGGLGQGGVRLEGGGLGFISNLTVTNAIEVAATGCLLSSELNAQAQPYRVTMAGGLSGAGSVVKVGAGTIWATGTWAQEGGTSVQQGGLMANGVLRGTVRVAGGFLGGAGRVGDVEVVAGGLLAPGSTYGVLTMSSLRLEQGAEVLCALDRADLGPGGGYAFGMVEGRLDLGALGPGRPAKLSLGGRLVNFDLARDQRFVLWRYGELVLAADATLPGCFDLDASVWQARLGDGFDPARLRLSADPLGRTVYLDYYSPIPEPGWYGLAMSGAVGVVAWLRRQRRTRRASGSSR